MAAAKRKRPPRKDPRPRHIDGVAPWTRLEGKDPGRRYVWVTMSDEEVVSDYESMGYRVEKASKDGVRPGAGKTCRIGETITMRGMQLMSIGLEEYEQIVEYGPDGNTGQDYLDKVEARLTAQKSAAVRRELMEGLDRSGAIGLDGMIQPGGHTPEEFFR